MCITASGALPSPAVPASLCPSQDEVRALGRLLGVPEQFIARHPFPGPGLAVRIIGDVTGELTFAGFFSWALALVHAFGLGWALELDCRSAPVQSGKCLAWEQMSPPSCGGWMLGLAVPGRPLQP